MHTINLTDQEIQDILQALYVASTNNGRFQRVHRMFVEKTEGKRQDIRDEVQHAPANCLACGS